MAEEHAANRLESYEKRFRRAGLPLFIEDFSARSDVFTRALPILILVFLAEVIGAIELEWSLFGNIAAVLGGLAILLIAFGSVNRLRNRRFTASPEDVGPIELGLRSSSTS